MRTAVYFTLLTFQKEYFPNGLITTTPIYIIWRTAWEIKDKPTKQENPTKTPSTSHSLKVVIFASP